MFTIRFYKIGKKVCECCIPAYVDTLAEAEIFALNKQAKWSQGYEVEIVYIEDLDYYVYVGGHRVGRVTITPFYNKKGITK